eukprot:TRINITY_DN1509_c0_g1_i1.p1 TRINITY_DN1509_c0_g1~~TRINITY_DN1509_c0_g1_i1.p1  ORF type:complete len:327 (+),score=86.66 TRINITY_DN1509_c0_g1_i1:92-1072(+)
MSRISSPTTFPPAGQAPTPLANTVNAIIDSVRPLPPPAYKDLLKAPKDILEDGFVRDINVLIENAGTPSNNFTVELNHSAKAPTRGSLKLKAEPVEVTFFGDSRFKADITLPVYAIGTSTLKAKVGHEYNIDTKDAKLSPTVEVKNDSVNFSATLESPYSLAITKAQDGTPIREVPYVPHRLNLQGAFRLIPGVLGGFSALFNSTGKWESFGIKAEYDALPTIVGTILNKTSTGLWEKNFYFAHPYSTNSRVAILLTHTATFQATCGIETALSPLTTFKTRADTNGAVGFAISHRMSAFSKLQASVLNGGGAAPSVGLSFSFSDKY